MHSNASVVMQKLSHPTETVLSIKITRNTEWMEWMSHRKQKETKQQPGTAGPGNIIGCCLVSLRFLCDIPSIHSVEYFFVR